MAQYRIVCTEKQTFEHPHFHSHIVKVGTGDGTGWNGQWTVSQVLVAMNNGETFYTQGPTSGKVALVHPYHCTHCNQTYIRSAPDAVADNNLDNLAACRW
jgi:hypothetical protein